VQKDGLIDMDDLKRAMDDKTILVTLMAANNEIGVLQPWAEIASYAASAAFCSTLTPRRLLAKFRSTVNKDNIDIMSISAHKMYGRRAWARCMSAARIRGCSWQPFSTAEATNAACVPEL